MNMLAEVGEVPLRKEVVAAIVTVRANTAKWNEFDIIHNELLRLAALNENQRVSLEIKQDLIERCKGEIARLHFELQHGRPSLLRRFINWMNEPLP